MKEKNQTDSKLLDSSIYTTGILNNALVLTMFKPGYRKFFPEVKIAIVLTDYHGHPYYKFSDIDYYFIPHPEIKKDLLKIGIKEDRVIVSGIPINPRFYINQDIQELKLNYGIKNNLNTVLLIASFHISKSKLVSMISQLLNYKPELNVLFVANGKNDIFSLISRNFKGHDRLFIVNWTNTIEEYIKMSDVVISKAGGLTVSECLAIKKPMIIVNPIPGQEDYNAEFVERIKMGIRIKNVKTITNVLPRYISLVNNEKRITLQENPSEKIFQVLLK